MVRGRIGGDGAPFNLGEATVTRAAVRLASGEVGFGYVLGRDSEKARLIAFADALMQSERYRARIEQRGAGADPVAPTGRAPAGGGSARPRPASNSSLWCVERTNDQPAERLRRSGARRAVRLPRDDGGDLAARPGATDRRSRGRAGAAVAGGGGDRAHPDRSRHADLARPAARGGARRRGVAALPHRRADRRRSGTGGVRVRRRPRARSTVRRVRARHAGISGPLHHARPAGRELRARALAAAERTRHPRRATVRGRAAAGRHRGAALRQPRAVSARDRSGAGERGRGRRDPALDPRRCLEAEMYVAVKGGERAIENAHRLLAHDAARRPGGAGTFARADLRAARPGGRPGDDRGLALRPRACGARDQAGARRPDRGDLPGARVPRHPAALRHDRADRYRRDGDPAAHLGDLQGSAGRAGARPDLRLHPSPARSRAGRGCRQGRSCRSPRQRPPPTPPCRASPICSAATI